MKKILALEAVMVLVFLSAAQTVVPNYVVTKKYLEDSKLTTSVKYTDGLGKDLQSRLDINSTEGMLNSIEYDDIGRVVKSWKSIPYNFGAQTKSFVQYSDFAAQAKANPLFSSSLYPFSLSMFSSDPLGRIEASGKPGLLYQPLASKKEENVPNLGKTGRANYYWYFGRITDAPLSFSQIIALNTAPATDYNQPNGYFFLTVTKDANGGFSQTFTNLAGKTTKRWTHTKESSSGNEEIVSVVSYDVLGNVLSETPPKENTSADILPSTYKYNSVGQIIEKFSPDAQTVKYKYNLLGNAIGIQNEKQRTSGSNGIYTATIYDALNRVAVIGTAIGFDELGEYSNVQTSDLTRIKIKNYYDNSDCCAELGLPSDIATTLTNLKGHLVCTVCYDESGSLTDVHRIIDVYSYNEDGKISIKYKIIPNLGVQKFAYVYDRVGNLLTEAYSDDIAKKSNQSFASHYFEYNSLGQLVAIRSGLVLTSPKLIEFQYDKWGKLGKKIIYKADGSTQISSTTMDYDNLLSLTKSITNSNSLGKGFTESLLYDDAPNPQYNGNIGKATMTYTGITAQSETHSYSYAYDLVNRLAAVDADAASEDEAFSYLKDGRIKQKVKNATTPESGTQYQYVSGKSQLKNQPFKAVTDNFIYDPNGNLVVDKSKKMVTIYDWRDMPIYFNFYTSINASTTWSNAEDINKAQLVSQVAMLYDAGGSRVLKTSLAK